MTTSTIPYDTRTFEVAFDFLDHTLRIQSSDGAIRAMGLYPRSVADFYRELLALLRAIDLDVAINPLPQEVANPIPCDEDHEHAAYDAAAVNRWWRSLAQSDRVLRQFRAGFLGKSSPVHFFWGSFDLAVTRFSGRRAPERPGADLITREAYSHEVSSCGFWPGTPGGPVQEAAYYAYMAPEPEGFGAAQSNRAPLSIRRKWASLFCRTRPSAPHQIQMLPCSLSPRARMQPERTWPTGTAPNLSADTW